MALDRSYRTSTQAQASSARRYVQVGILITVFALLQHIRTLRPVQPRAFEAGGTVEYVRVESGEFVYRIPAVRSTTNGIVLFLHGSSRSATDFFEQSSECSTCVGLPVERALVELAEGNGYVPLAVSSTDRRRKRWFQNWETAGADYDHIANAVEHLDHRLTRVGLSTEGNLLEVVVVGVSNGCPIASTLVMSRLGHRLHGLVCMISSLHTNPPNSVSQRMKIFPPTAFIQMGYRSKDSPSVNAKDIAWLESHSIPSVDFKLTRLAFSQAFCETWLPKYGAKGCESLRLALRKSKHLDEQDYLMQNPRSMTWRDAAREQAVLAGDTLQPDNSPLCEVLNLAYGQHEITAEHFADALQWIRSARRIS